jgi:hypothetical protein
MVALHASQVVSSQNGGTASLNAPIPEANTCHPGSGWRWTTGPLQPEIAFLVQQELSQMRIGTSVEARSYGETDSCGKFRLFGIDFTITVRGESRVSEIYQQQLTEKIYPTLVKFGKPNLGNVKITFPQGNTITLNDKVLADQLAALTLTAYWQQVTTTISPQGRYIYGFAYDSHRQVAVLFGGDSTGSARLNDTWEYDGTNWRQVSPSQSPPGRANIDRKRSDGPRPIVDVLSPYRSVKGISNIDSESSFKRSMISERSALRASVSPYRRDCPIFSVSRC